MALYKTNLSPAKADIALLIFRIAIGCMMLVHGIPKLMTLFTADTIEFADPFGAGETASLTLAVFAEVVCSILLILGLATRLATIPLIITMCVAVFMVHPVDGWGRQELGSLYLAAYVLLLIAGPGKYALDYVFKKK
ncbi:MAG: DoxX family protein [Cytophagaceae bacterium]|nr:DoxX family protein [Cytophagaceae bacterium]|tara:strand:- start:90 stop:500 length:411 start_codon:yes stop_codon:yes gene_type:complete